VVTDTPATHGSHTPPRRRMRPSPPRIVAAGRTALAALLTLVLAAPAWAAAPAAHGAAKKAVDPESLPIPEGSSAPTAISGGVGGTMLRLGLGLAVVVGLIALIWYVMKRYQRSKFPALEERGTAGGLIDVVTTTPLGPSRSLHLVRVGDELVLVGSTDHNITPLARLGAGEASAVVDAAMPPPAPDGRGFGRSRPGPDPRARAAATASAGSLVDRLRDLTTRRT
jgi:flagellar protein FliO/FliZ